MDVIRALGRTIGVGVVQSLCSRHGAALVVAGVLTLAGGASVYLSQHAAESGSGTPTAQVGQAQSCGTQDPGYSAYVPETNQFYCVSGGN